MKQINVFAEMVVYVTVDCQSDSRQGKAWVFINSQGTKWSSDGAQKNVK